MEKSSQVEILTTTTFPLFTLYQSYQSIHCYIGMSGPKGYGFSAVLVINRVSIEADFGHFGHK